MTAVGFLLAVTGLIWVWMSNPWRTTWINLVGSICLVTGVPTFSVGIAIWLWRVMP